MATSDEDDLLAGLRSHLTGEQERLAQLQKQAEEARARAAALREKMMRTRQGLADQADAVGEQARAFAANLEAHSGGHPDDRRKRLAQREREIAAVESRNAARLREEEATGPLGLEAPPPLIGGVEGDSEGPPG